MKRYSIQPLRMPLPDLCGVFDPEDEPFCQEYSFASIDNYVWDVQGYCPEARAYCAWDADGIHVLLCAMEKEISTEATEFNGDVYRDSCLECFLQPFADDPRYLNIETNAAGVALIGFGSSRADRIRLSSMPEGMDIQASRHRGAWWAVSYVIPKTLLEELYGRTPKPGDVMRGNFYKCDETIHPHFGSWSPIIHFQPDFHRPEWFGELVLEP